ncbi:MAG: M28 family peptidase [Terriglobales bacterium]
MRFPSRGWLGCLAWLLAGALPLAAASAAVPFSGRAAYRYTAAVVAFGPRPPGTAAHRRTVAYILAQLRRDGARIVPDHFVAHTPRGPFHEVNIIAKFGPRQGQILMLAGHYDTKFEPFRFVGANDGGSSTGLLLEAGAVLAKQPPSAPVWLLFLDGEEAVNHWTATDSVYGSRQLAAQFQHEGLVPRIHALILVDMIGDQHLDVLRETNSTAWLNSFVAAAARRLGYSRYFFQQQGAIEDDHLPFLHVGIPAVDLIDFTYGPNNNATPGPYWHTAQDTMDKLSPHSFTVVGRVVMETLRMLEAQ